MFLAMLFNNANLYFVHKNCIALTVIIGTISVTLWYNTSVNTVNGDMICELWIMNYVIYLQ